MDTTARLLNSSLSFTATSFDLGRTIGHPANSKAKRRSSYRSKLLLACAFQRSSLTRKGQAASPKPHARRLRNPGAGWSEADELWLLSRLDHVSSALVLGQTRINVRTPHVRLRGYNIEGLNSNYPSSTRATRSRAADQVPVCPNTRYGEWSSGVIRSGIRVNHRATGKRNGRDVLSKREHRSRLVVHRNCIDLLTHRERNLLAYVEIFTISRPLKRAVEIVAC